MLTLSLSTARHLQLAAQGLLTSPAAHPRPQDLLAAIRTMSLLQIDTINVVARSPYLVLFSRLGAYPTAWLEQALSQGELFEYWAHEACFIPVGDYSLLRHRMLSPEALGWKYSASWMAEHRDDIQALLKHIEVNGPVRSADFATAADHQPGWWAWKPHKRHLENLFTAGELMVTERRNFQRVYDLRQRVLPDWHDGMLLTEAEAIQQMLLNSAKSLGIFRAEWLADYYRLKKAPIVRTLERWLEQQIITEVEIETLGKAYVHQQFLPLLESKITATHTTVLSPFDPLVWHRKRALELFDFDYRLECYTPEAKRRYGYFVLPLLHRGALKGRMDAKMLRKERILQIKNIWIEPGTRVTGQFTRDLKLAISRFASWQGADQVQVAAMPAELSSVWQNSWYISA